MLKLLKGMFSVSNGIKYLSYSTPNRYSLQTLNKLETLKKMKALKKDGNSTENALLDSIVNSMGLKVDLSDKKAKLAQELSEAFTNQRYKGNNIHFD